MMVGCGSPKLDRLNSVDFSMHQQEQSGDKKCLYQHSAFSCASCRHVTADHLPETRAKTKLEMTPATLCPEALLQKPIGF